jgi:hypothetical protein
MSGRRKAALVEAHDEIAPTMLFGFALLAASMGGEAISKNPNPEGAVEARLRNCSSRSPLTK